MRSRPLAPWAGRAGPLVVLVAALAACGSSSPGLSAGASQQLQAQVQAITAAAQAGDPASAAADLSHGSVTFQFPISGSAPAVTVLKKGQTSANCAGIGSGSAPSATAGNLCIYLTEEVNLDETAPLIVENNTRLGFGLVAKSKDAGDFAGFGQWAVTAP